MKITCHINLVPKVHCITLWWKDLRYRHTFLFILVLFVSPWHDFCPQLQYVYHYVLINLEWNLKPLVSCVTLFHNPKSNWSTANWHQNRHQDIRHSRHTCHRCIYLLVTVVFAVIICRITFSLNFTWFFHFSCSFDGIRNIAIRWSSDIHPKQNLVVCSVRLLYKSTSAHAFFFSCLILLIFFCTVINTSTNSALRLNIVCYFTISYKKTELLSWI